MDLISLFDKASESPEFIPKLRQLILDLAVRGKLVSQNPKDEPASELLKKIKAEKDKLVKEKMIRLEKPLPPISPDEIPFEIPRSWLWTFLGDISQYGISEKVDSNKDLSPETWVLDLEDIEKNTSRLIERVLSSSRPFQSSKTKFMKGDVLFGKLRPYLNKVLVADKDGVCTTEIVPVRGFCKINPEYVRLVFKSPLTMKRVDHLMYGMKMPRLGTSDAIALKFPLPPLPEQKRIVAKVDELMSLCDELEAVHESRDEKREHLNLASLKAVTDARTPEDFKNASGFFINHLTEITVTQDHIKNLRQTILDLAVRGKLVPQNPKDEPASELLKRIENEKTILLKNGIIKKSEAVRPSSGKNINLELPNGWSPTNLQMLCISISDGDHQPPPKAEEGVPFLVIGNVRTQTLDFDGCRHVTQEYYNSLDSIRRPQENDILYTLVGSYGIPVMLIDDRPFCVQRHIGILRPSRQVDVGFLCRVLKSNFVFSQATACATGSAQKTVPLSGLRKIFIPLPPLPEQKRIVAKVDELMSLCDTLEKQISITSTQSTRLLNALLQEGLFK